jgi:hypothetical protein
VEQWIMNSRCNKTEAGRAEIKARALPLSRTARNLLLIIDGSRPVAEWLGLVHGATEADVDGLLAQGLIEPVAAPAAAPSRSGNREPSVEQLTAAMNALSYDQLYTLLTSQAKERFGLIKGYRFVLEVEKCANLQEMQGVAQRFLSELKQEHGEAGMRHLRLALGIQG